jgi:hypothetical protein
MLLAFGNQMQAKWQGISMQDVYLDWAEALQQFSLGAINHGIKLARVEAHPPSQGEFINFCKQYLPPLIENRLEKLHVKDTAVGLAKINEFKEMLARKMTEASHEPA